MLAVDWASVKTTIHPVHVSIPAQRQHKAIRLSFVPWMIDVATLEPLSYHIATCRIGVD